MAVIIVALNQEQESSDPFMGFMNTLLSEEKSPHEKKQILSNDYHLPFEDDLEQEVTTMCNYSDYVEERKTRKIILRMLQNGRDIKTICEDLDVDPEYVKKIEKELLTLA